MFEHTVQTDFIMFSIDSGFGDAAFRTFDFSELKNGIATFGLLYTGEDRYLAQKK